MSEYERYATIEEITELTVEQLHMIDYVTDVVLITNNHECFQIYRGPHDDFYLEFFDIRELLQQSFSSQTNTTLADISSLTTQNTAGNRNGFFYVKRIIDSQNTSSNIGYILHTWINKPFSALPMRRISMREDIFSTQIFKWCTRLFRFLHRLPSSISLRA